MKKKFTRMDAIVDIIIIALLVFTVIITVNDDIMKFILTVAGCGAMYNNVKYAIAKTQTKKQKEKKQEQKKKEQVKKNK
jgi:uncharacterized membrane protein